MGKPLRERVRSVRRDWSMVVRGLVGQPSRPFALRDGHHWPHAPARAAVTTRQLSGTSGVEDRIDESIGDAQPANSAAEPALGSAEAAQRGRVSNLSAVPLAARVTILLDGEQTQIQVPAGLTILEAAEDAGVLLPHSCALGGCGACACTVVSGSVDVPDDACLTDEERSENTVLACVGRPTSSQVTVTFD
ncbi:MAG: 2Fe-2S iron-sulfur cluster binding domain-containing protein [Myxococcales bacterium]|nr:2Fe-2S iron-sulfur cluster binding domain-containing protein [Myxococcales bacterium]